MPTLVKHVSHSQESLPRPHIVYNFEIERDGIIDSISKRYSEFASLHVKLGVTGFELPPKRLLVTTFIPSAWSDETLIAERKAGLEQYLIKLLETPQYKQVDAVQEFLALSSLPEVVELEDVVPSTLSRKTAEELVAAAAKSFISAAYYPSWTQSYPPEKLDYSKFDILFFAFAIPSSSGTLIWDSGTQDMLKRLVASAKKSGKGTKIVLSVGGWSGSGAFHQITGNSSTRSKLVSALKSAVTNYKLDGIDIDWEYPNDAGAGNAYGPADAANLLIFLKQLRTALGSSKIISAAVTDLPWLGANGRPLTDLSEYASQLTYANLMNYDINGPWSSTPGPNAPYGNLCGNSSQPAYSAESAFNQWTAAKFPASKLLLGLPLYGYVYNSTRTTLSQFTLLEGQEPEGDAAPDSEAHERDEDILTPDTAAIRGAHKEPIHPELERAEIRSAIGTEATAQLSSWWGQQISFRSLVALRVLVKNSEGKYDAGNGFTRAWDGCSKTPFLYSREQHTVVSYDDTSSLEAKSSLAKSKGIAGCFTWSLDQDDGLTLQNAIRKGLGK
ncbi:glycoside hydrolase family 18 protein [Favolaschia claudopus]|uniref:Glycoside hydrolase family 18 protein n=1 Tax=Favolaschia claudopus TaxID=2862362 RepID=A0AAW0DX90_9AGAR